MNKIAIAIMAKVPIPGLAKTRLIPLLGADGAAKLQARLLQRTLFTALDAGVGPVDLWATPDHLHPDISAFRHIGNLTLHTQPKGDLGARMLWALIHGPTVDGILIIGTDCPGLTPDILRSAAKFLITSEVVLVPAEDGGYAMIGMRRPVPEIFAGIDWGSENVLAQTRERIASLHLQSTELQTLWDIDTPADFQRLSSSYPEMTDGINSMVPAQ